MLANRLPPTAAMVVAAEKEEAEQVTLKLVFVLKVLVLELALKMLLKVKLLVEMVEKKVLVMWVVVVLVLLEPVIV